MHLCGLGFIYIYITQTQPLLSMHSVDQILRNVQSNIFYICCLDLIVISIEMCTVFIKHALISKC